MSTNDDAVTMTAAATAFPWILEHLLAYPGTYELPLRTMYTLNCASQTPTPSTASSPTMSHVPGNAFPRSPNASAEDQQHMSTATAAAQLRANLMTHIAQMSAQPTSLPPNFITSFVRKCFAPELSHVDFAQSLTAMDYLKDLEIRRRSEILAAMEKLGVDRADLSTRDQLAATYPGLLRWLDGVEEKEKKIEAIYSQVYVGLRRWTLVNEMSLVPFNKSNCIAMLNTLYPPMGMSSSQFVPPTAQLTAAILTEQRNAFFRYITAVERKGHGVLSSLKTQHKRPGDETGWPSLREALDHYLTLANAVIDECWDITGRMTSPTSPSFVSPDLDDARRQIDSGISLASSGHSSNRSSGQSHLTRPSTSSSYSTHSRHPSKDKALPEKPLPSPKLDPAPPSPKPAGTTLERIARELRRIRSKSNVRDGSQARPATSHAVAEPVATDAEQTPPVPAKGLRLKRSLRKMRSSSAVRERDSTTPRPGSRAEEQQQQQQHNQAVPAFDAEEMRMRRQEWEASQSRISS